VNGTGYSLGSLVTQAKERYGVTHFLVWHTLSGYWGGVSPTSPALAAFLPELSFPHLPYPASMRRMSVAQALDE